MKKYNYMNNKYIKVYSFIQKRSLGKVKELMYYIDRFLMLFVKKNNIKDNKKSIAIIFNLALGDGIDLRCALKDLNKIYSKKEYSITLFCQKGLKEIYEDLDILDNIIELDFNKATVNLKERFKNLKVIASKKYDLLLDPTGANGCYTNVLMSRCIRAKEKIGCIIQNKKVTTSNFILKKTYTHLKYLTESSLIGLYFEYFYDNKNVEYHKIKGIKPKLELPKEYYIVFPSASLCAKRWPIERYAEIVKRVYNKTKLPLLICGTNADKEANDKLISLIGDIPYVNIINKTNLREFIYVVNNAKFVITNDTSTYHIAVINEIPVAIITGGYTYDKYVIYNFKGSEKYKKPYVIINKMDCFNCDTDCTKIKKEDVTWPCLYAINTEYAWNIINDMIDKELK